MARRPADRRFLAYMALILALAALAWAVLRAWNVMQDHERNDATAAASSRVAGFAAPLDGANRG